MIMRSFLYASLIAFGATPSSGAQRFEETCKENRQYCLGLVRGQVDALSAAGIPQFGTCIPPGLNDEKILSLTINWLASHPSGRTTQVAPMTEALLSEFCVGR